MAVLGLLLLAGLGVAAAALVEHVDSSGVEDDPEDHTPPDEGDAPQGDLLDDVHAGPDDHGDDHGATDDHAATDDQHAAGAEDHTDPAPVTDGAFPEGQSGGDAGDDGAHAAGGTEPAPDGAAAQPGDASGDPAPGANTDPTTDPTATDAAPGGDTVGGASGDATAEAVPTDATSTDTAPAGDALAAPAPVHNFFGGSGDDSLEGTTGRDLLEGGGGNDILQGRGGADHLVAFDQGQDTLWGGMGADSLHGYTVNSSPGGDTSFIIEDRQADHLYGGLGADKLWLGSGDVGTGGAGADEFHVSWDIDHDNPATITDYHPRTDRIVVEFTTNRADDDMTPITAADQQLTTHALEDGSGTAICLNGQPIAHVLGTTALRASDISLVHL